MRLAPAAAAVVALLAACASDSAPHPTAAAPPAALQLVLDHPDAPPTDVVEVFVCDVPIGTTDPLYGDRPLRLPLDPARISAQLNAGVSPYFAAISHGLYTPSFVAGTTLAMTTVETHDGCAERAVDASAASTTVVMVVATAEDLDTQVGGWGRPGAPCAVDPCAARATRRAMYVGASDFFAADTPDHISDTPLLDLIEHELGHTLDLPHSGEVGDDYASALDVMSDSAAPRASDPARIHGPDTIAVNRLALGWLPPDDVITASREGGTFELAPSTSPGGTRLLVLPVDDTTFLSVELLEQTGFDDQLPHSGLAVHRIDQASAVCGATRPEPCTGIDRRQVTLNGGPAHTGLLTTASAALSADGWTVRMRSEKPGSAVVEVLPSG